MNNVGYYQAIHDYLSAQSDLEQISGNIDFDRYKIDDKK